MKLRAQRRIARNMLCVVAAATLALGTAPSMMMPCAAWADDAPVEIVNVEGLAQAAGTYSLTANAYSASTIMISADTTVDLNGHTLTVASGPAFQIAEGASLTLTDSTLNAGTLNVSSGGVAQFAGDTGSVRICGGRYVYTASDPFQGGANASKIIECGVFPTGIGDYRAEGSYISPANCSLLAAGTMVEVVGTAANSVAGKATLSCNCPGVELAVAGNAAFSGALTRIANGDEGFLALAEGQTIAAAQAAIADGSAVLAVSINEVSDNATKARLISAAANQLAAGKTAVAYFTVTAELRDASGSVIGTLLPGAYSLLGSTALLTASAPSDKQTLSESAVVLGDGASCIALDEETMPGMFLMDQGASVVLGNGVVLGTLSDVDEGEGETGGDSEEQQPVTPEPVAPEPIVVIKYVQVACNHQEVIDTANARIKELEEIAKHVDELEAANARIPELEAENAKIPGLEEAAARVDELLTENARIPVLEQQIVQLTVAASKQTQVVKVSTTSKSVKLKPGKKRTTKTESFSLGVRAKTKATCVLEKKAKNSKRITATKRGRVKLKKGTKRGTYRATVLVSVPAGRGYAAAKVAVTVRFVVK